MDMFIIILVIGVGAVQHRTVGSTIPHKIYIGVSRV